MHQHVERQRTLRIGGEAIDLDLGDAPAFSARSYSILRHRQGIGRAAFDPQARDM
jgi:hypothetical protein